MPMPTGENRGGKDQGEDASVLQLGVGEVDEVGCQSRVSVAGAGLQPAADPAKRPRHLALLQRAVAESREGWDWRILGADLRIRGPLERRVHDDEVCGEERAGEVEVIWDEVEGAEGGMAVGL